jgi:hypothetical protein
MNTSNPRQTHILWVKGGFRGVAPQASAIPGFATARLKNNVLILAQGVWRTFRDSRASRLAGLPEALPLPRRYQASINLLKTHDKLAGYSGYGQDGQDGQDLIIMLLDNWADSYCWDVQLPESQGDGEAVASDIPRPRPPSSNFQTRTFGAWCNPPQFSPS